jgi:lipoate-protein ligase A
MSRELIPIDESNLPKRIKNVTSLLATLKQLHPEVAQMKMLQFKEEIRKQDRKNWTKEDWQEAIKNKWTFPKLPQGHILLDGAQRRLAETLK